MRTALLCGASLLLSVAAHPQVSRAPRPLRPAKTLDSRAPRSIRPAGKLDPQGVAALTRMSNYLKTLQRFKASTETTTEEIVDHNMKVQKRAAAEIAVRRPDRLSAEVTGDDRQLRFVYDGATFTLYSKEGNYYATTAAPPTLARTMDAIRARYGVVFPLADFIYMASNEDLLKGAAAIGYIGTSVVDGTECEHVAVRQDDVDWQVWIEKGDRPLPRKYVITTRSQAQQPQYEARVSWDVSFEPGQDQFTFQPPTGASRIPFARLRPAPLARATADARGTN